MEKCKGQQPSLSLNLYTIFHWRLKNYLGDGSANSQTLGNTIYIIDWNKAISLYINRLIDLFISQNIFVYFFYYLLMLFCNTGG